MDKLSLILSLIAVVMAAVSLLLSEKKNFCYWTPNGRKYKLSFNLNKLHGKFREEIGVSSESEVYFGYNKLNWYYVLKVKDNSGITMEEYIKLDRKDSLHMWIVYLINSDYRKKINHVN